MAPPGLVALYLQKRFSRTSLIVCSRKEDWEFFCVPGRQKEKVSELLRLVYPIGLLGAGWKKSARFVAFELVQI